MSDDLWLSAAECNQLSPDADYGSTIDNLEALYATSIELKCWKPESVSMGRIDPGQLLDDPDDVDGDAKVESIRESVRTGAPVPPCDHRSPFG